MQPSTAQCSPVQSSTAQFSSVQSGTAQYSPVQFNTAQYSLVQSSTVQYSPVQSITAQYSQEQTSKAQYSLEEHSTTHYSTVQPSAVHYSPSPPVQVKVYHHVYISTLSRQSFAQKHPGLVFMTFTLQAPSTALQHLNNLVGVTEQQQTSEKVKSFIVALVSRGFSYYSNVGRLFCTPAPPKFTKKLAVDSFFNFGS